MNARTWLRWIAPVVLVVVVLVALRDRMPFFGDAWRAVRSASPPPLLGTVVTALLALVAMAGVMQILLNVEGRITGVASTNAIVFASNAWSTTVPGGPALSAWLTYRVQRTWGASTGLCGWFFVVSGALSTVWLVLIGIVAVVLLGADLSVTSLVLSLVAAALTIAAVFWATLNPAVLKRWTRFLPDRVRERAVSVIDQVSAIRISAPAFAGTAGLSLCNRLLDLATMVCAVWAVSSSSISLSGICLAFIMTKLAGSAQVTPGGLGTVEPVAVGMLVSGGLSLADATAATVIYRAISFALVTAIGWIVYSAVYLGRVDKPTA